MSGQDKEIWYRFEDHLTAPMVDEFEEPIGQATVNVRCLHFAAEKHTNKGVWLRRIYGGGFMAGEARFVLTSANRKFACPTIEEAKVSFRARKAKQIKILERRISNARKALQLVERIER